MLQSNISDKKSIYKYMIQQKINDSIEHLSSTPFLHAVRNRPLQKHELQRYLSNIYYVLLQTSPCLQMAAEVATQRNEMDLVEFFKKKREDEEGHFRWAEDDLKAFLGTEYEWTEEQVLKPMMHLVELQKSTIATNPKAYLGYITFAESLTVALGDQVVSNVKVSCIEKHIAIDTDHVEDDYEIITGFLQSEEDVEDLLQHITRSVQTIEKFFEEIIHGHDAKSTSAAHFAPEMEN